MKKTFLTVLLACLCLFGAYAQTLLEDFEGGVADLPWVGLNGTYDGVVTNPDQSGINTSLGVGKYTNAPGVDFSFALAVLAAPIDLSKFSLVKMKVWSPTAPSQVLFKLEGGGKAVQKFIDITVANEWVEYSFDLSGGAGFTTLNTILVSFNPFVLGDAASYYFDDIRLENNEVCFVDFEGPGLTFLGLDGTFTAPVPNPDPNFINPSANVGKYDKSNLHAFSLLLAESPDTIDLSVYNQFKLDIYTSAPTQVIMKLEGPGLPGIERIRNIAVVNAWQEYTFDFSGITGVGYTKVILFFDPGVETSGDTYYIDNLCAVPQGACAGVTPDPEILDDFECNRNATYSGGWDSLTVIANPYPNGDNNSPQVGEYKDVAGPGTEYAALVINYQNPIDLSERNQFSVKVWSSKPGTLLLKIQGGMGQKEVPFQITELNKWVTYSVDFSDQVGKGHRELVIFFNAGVNGAPGDTYYIDDIKLSAPTAVVLEDFQGGVHLAWQPLDQNEVIHGTFNGPTANTTPNTVNSSTQVGCYTKGTSAFSTLQAILPVNNLDLSPYGQFNIDVLSPANGGTVTMQLSSPTEGNKEATATITTPGAWETLSFDFSAFDAITNFGEIRLIFNAGTAAAGQGWCVDNLTQSKLTIDPCATVVPNPNIIADFECQQNYVSIFYGEADLKVVNNPHLAPENGSLKVGEYIDPAGAFAGIGIEFATPPDLTLYNHLKFQVWSPKDNVPFLIKLQGPVSVEVFDTLPAAGVWHTFDIDFSGAVGTAAKQIVIFFNVLDEAGGGTYYIDNIQWSRAGYNGCVANHESPALIDDWKYFANGHLEAEGYEFQVVDNPNPSGINTSPKVGEFIKAGDAQPFAGMYTFPDLEAPIDFRGVKTVRVKVYMNHIGNFAAKLEGSTTGAPFIEIAVANTKINEWEEITINFAAAPDNGDYRRLTIFFDLTIDATGSDVTSYFDDIVIGDGDCGDVSVFNPGPVPTMSVVPNPATSILFVENFQDVARIDVFNAYGQRVASVTTVNETRTDLDVSQLPAGMYSLAGFSKQGVLLGNAKFVKQ